MVSSFSRKTSYELLNLKKKSFEVSPIYAKRSMQQWCNYCLRARVKYVAHVSL
jgi:hypothetical protein